MSICWARWCIFWLLIFKFFYKSENIISFQWNYLYYVLILDKFIGCEYCPLEFQSRQDRIQHTATHFKSKTCTTCHKVLLCINGDWYELHASPYCDTKNYQQNDLCETHVANEIKSEEFDFLSDTGQAFKSEANNYGSSDEIDRDNRAFDSLSILEPHIEMKPIPQFVKSLAKLKTNLTISRTRIKKSPNVWSHEIAPTKVRRRNRTPATTTRNKPASNKASFLDHRPQGMSLYFDKTLLFPFNSQNHLFVYVFEQARAFVRFAIKH